jgi:hypothetical protein
VDRVLDLLGLPAEDAFRWDGPSKPGAGPAKHDSKPDSKEDRTE